MQATAPSRRQKTELLRGVGLFAGLTGRSLGSIAELMVEASFTDGRPIVRQGEIGTGFYVIISGRARVTRDGLPIASLGPGEFFGELSLITRAPRIAAVTAEGSTTCLAIASWEFEKLLLREPRITMGILREVAARWSAVSQEHRS